MKNIAKSENIEDFTDSNFIYVDKTEYIYKLTKDYKKVFFSRPRRFGKSLTLNSIGTLFEFGVDPYFKGTWIYDKWDQAKYPVLHLSFLEYSVTDIDEFKKALCQSIHNFARLNSVSDYTDDTEPTNLIKNIFTVMPARAQIVILIDEYDCQLTANINKPELYEKFRICIRDFYAVLKGKKQIKFMAVTGVTRLKDVSIFSVGNDVDDLSYAHSFSQMIGFTRDEIRKYYIDYLKLGVSYEKNQKTNLVTDAEVEEFLDRMAEHYDSYCFDEFFENKVFSTYSVNCFLQSLSNNRRVVFGDYWYDAGGIPSILMNYMDSHNFDTEKLVNSEITISYNDFKNPTSLLDINKHVLMCQTGYLTLKSAIVTGDTVTLGPANRELRTALFLLLSLKIFDRDNSAFSSKNRYVIESGTADEIISLLNSVFGALSYDKYPVNNESVLRALLQVYLIGRNHNVSVESHNNKGRSDILINFPKRRVVLELKYTTKAAEEQKKLDAALNQITDNGYGLENLGERELLRIACVFNGDKSKRRITRFKTV